MGFGVGTKETQHAEHLAQCLTYYGTCCTIREVDMVVKKVMGMMAMTVMVVTVMLLVLMVNWGQ